MVKIYLFLFFLSVYILCIQIILKYTMFSITSFCSLLTTLIGLLSFFLVAYSLLFLELTRSCYIHLLSDILAAYSLLFFELTRSCYIHLLSDILAAYSLLFFELTRSCSYIHLLSGILAVYSLLFFELIRSCIFTAYTLQNKNKSKL